MRVRCINEMRAQNTRMGIRARISSWPKTTDTSTKYCHENETDDLSHQDYVLTLTAKPAQSIDGSMLFSSLSLPLYRPSGNEALSSREGCRLWEAMRFLGRFGKPMQTSVCNDRVSETPCGMGGSGLFFGAAFAVLFPSDDKEGELFATRRSRLRFVVVGGASDSSPELELASALGLYRGEGRDKTVTCRRSVTEMVASAAISRASVDERGLVVKTTKKGMYPERGNVGGSGKVICERS